MLYLSGKGDKHLTNGQVSRTTAFTWQFYSAGLPTAHPLQPRAEETLLKATK